MTLSRLTTVLDNWSPDEEPIDYIVLNGQSSPGYAEIVGLSAPRRIQIQDGMGWNDAAVRFAGFNAQKFSVRFHLYNPDDWKAWHRWKKVLAKRVTETAGENNKAVAAALPIWHPFLADPLIAVQAVIVFNVIGPVRGEESGEWVHEVEFVSYRRPKRQFLSYTKTEPEAEADQNAKDIQRNTEEITRLIAAPKP